MKTKYEMIERFKTTAFKVQSMKEYINLLWLESIIEGLTETEVFDEIMIIHSKG